jgi:MoaA/NifB/PqqE/SkfB family radical SAM enzyme
MKWEYLRDLPLLAKGRRGTLIWAITSACNCRCEMCSMWKKKPVSIDYEKAKDIIKHAELNQIYVLSLTGGEPFLNPDIFRIIQQAKSRRFRIHCASNGTLLTEERVKLLKEVGLDLLTLSFDYYKPCIHDQIRGHRNCFSKAINVLNYCKKIDLSVCATTVINRFNVSDIENHIRYFSEELDIGIGFCFPSLSPNEEFFANESKVIDISNEELIDCFEKILKMRNEGYKIYNTKIFLKQSIDFLKGKEVTKCLSGERVFYCDWNGSIYPCFNKDKICRYNEKWKKKIDCNECLVQCFREPSIICQRPWEILFNPQLLSL